MTTLPRPSRFRAAQRCLVAAVTAVTCAGLLCAAALAPAPAMLLPFIAATCIVCPMLAAWDLPSAVAALRDHRAGNNGDARALAELRAGLAKLPETTHPLGL